MLVELKREILEQVNCKPQQLPRGGNKEDNEGRSYEHELKQQGDQSAEAD